MRRIFFILYVVTVVSGLSYAGILLHYGKISTNVNLSLSPNWVLWLKFDEGEGNKAYDSSIYNRTISVLGYDVSWESLCKLNKCLKFNYTGDSKNYGDCCVGEVVLPSVETKGWSIVTWIYLFNITGTYKIAKDNIQVTNGYITCRFNFKSLNSDVKDYTAPKKLETNKWYFIVCNGFITPENKGVINITINNETYSSGILGDYYYVTLAQNSFYIGSDGCGKGTGCVKGKIDDFAVFNVSLSQDEITAEYLREV